MNRCKQSALILLLLAGVQFFFPPVSQAATRKVTIFLLDRVSLTDLATHAGPFLKAKLNKGALALITTKTAGTRSAGNTHATLSAGTPALSDRPGGLALNADEQWMGVPAATLYHQLTGDPGPTGQVIIPRLPEAVRLNFSASRTAIPGLMGSVLKENGLATAVLGNADLAPLKDGNPYYSHSRYAPWVAADRRGMVDYGDIGAQTLETADGVLPWESNYEYILTQYQNYREKADFLVLELGDLARLDALHSYLFDRQITEEKTRLFTRLDHFLKSVWPLINFKEEVVILLTPTPSLVNLKAGSYLTPCLMWGEAVSVGLLSSPTTRRPGLVANIDFAPTVFSLFALGTPAYVTGRAMTTVRDGDFATLVRMEARINATGVFRRKIIPVFSNVAAAALPLALLAGWALSSFNSLWSTVYRPWLLFFSLFLSALPLALHLTSQLQLSSLLVFALVTLGMAFLFTLLSWKLAEGSKRSSLFLLLPPTLLLLVVFSDLLSGATLIQSSILGYDPMLGARYYGIGNELAGLFLGSLLSVVIRVRSTNTPHPVSSWFFVFLIGTVFILAAPGIGANFGASLTALAMALTLYFSQKPAKHFYKYVPLYLFVLFLFALAVLTFDYFAGNPELQSHFGRLIKDFKLRGLPAVGEMIRRKLLVNLRLLASRWTLLLLSGLLTFIAAYFRSRKPFPANYLLVTLNGGLVGLFLNDSGLVFAALFFYPLATTALLIRGSEK